MFHALSQNTEIKYGAVANFLSVTGQSIRKNQSIPGLQKDQYESAACSYMVILLRCQEISTLGHQP